MPGKYFHVFIIFFAVLLSFTLHFKIFSYDLIGYHVWRQTQTQTVIDNFCKEDFSILNPRLNNLAYPDGIIRMEFPLYQWMIASACKLFGHPVLIARIITFITGILSGVGFYLLCRSIFKDKLLSAVGAWAILFSPVFYYYMVNPLPDNLGLCFGIYSLYFFCEYLGSEKDRTLYLYALFLCLATLVKLPFILFGTPFVLLLIRKKIRLRQAILFMLLLLPSAAWYTAVISTWGDNGIIAGVFWGGFGWFTYLDYIQHNFISTLPELFINYAALILFFAGVFFCFKKRIYADNGIGFYFFWLLIIVTAYVLFELNMIAKVHDYYLFPYLPMLFLITLSGFKELLKNDRTKTVKILAVICVVAMPVTAFLRTNTRWNLEDPGFNKVFLEKKNEIHKLIPQDAICLTGNDDSGVINLYYMNRKGYTFYENQLNAKLLEWYKQKGVSYLVSDAQLPDDLVKSLSDPSAVFNDVRIYRLK